MKKCSIVVNAYTASASELNQPNRICKELIERGVEAKIVKNATQELFAPCDFYVYLDKDPYYAQMLERRARLFNCAEAIRLCDDKMLTHLALSGFPMPETVPSALCYTEGATPSEDLLNRVERLGYPVVVKECYGSLGKGVYLAKDREGLKALSLRLIQKPHLYQKFITTSYGRDVRVIVIGNRAVAAMQRISQNDFRSNAALGGEAEPYTLSDADKTLCVEIAKRLKLDYCGIDLLFGEGGFLVCEVNSNAFFGTLERVTGVNVAGRYAQHMVEVIYG